MKKTILFLLALRMTFALLPAAYAETTTTVLMYMCGTDLQSACVEDMYEMCTGNYSDQITVAVQAGGATEWDDSDLTPNALNRFTIADGGFYDLEVLDWASRRWWTFWNGACRTIRRIATCWFCGITAAALRPGFASMKRRIMTA